MLSKILSKDNKSINAILIYGNMSEQIIAEDCVVRPINMFIHSVLKANGFDNIVFYDATNARGKSVKDDVSAVYSFSSNRSKYLRKYGSLPKGVDDFGVISSPDTDDYSFGRPGNVIEEEQTISESDNDEDKLQWSEQNMDLTMFFNEVTHYMENDQYRSCIVFSNLYDILHNGNGDFVRRLNYLLNFEYENGLNDNGNLIIFLQPDINDSNSLQAFVNVLINSTLRDKFMIVEQGNDGNGNIIGHLDEERCFFLDVPDNDEIGRLLRKYSIDGQLKYTDSTEKLAKRLNYLLRESCERANANGHNVRPTNLLKLNEKIMSVIKANGGCFQLDMDNLDSFCYMPIEFEPDPEKKLRETKGWEGVYSQIDSAIKKFKRLNPEYGQSVDLSIEEKERYRYIPDRLRNRSIISFPTADKLPSFALMGPPGVGKTTVSRLFGRIFTDAGMLKTGHVVCARASDIISQYVGGTYAKVSSLLDRCEGGVLFIDEAYELYSDPNDNRGTNYKKQAINALVQGLTDNTRHFILILAGYPNSKPDSVDGVEALFNCNPGLRSRISNLIYIKDYSAELLAEVTMNRFLSNKAGLTVDESITLTGLHGVWDKRLRKRNKRTFGNARDAIHYADEVLNNAINDMRTSILPQDFPEDDRGLVIGKKESFDEIIENIKKEYPGGLGEIASNIAKNIVCRVNSDKERAAKLRKTKPSIKSMIFTGKPGSGKTTIAKILPKLLGSMGIMSGSDPVIIADPKSCTPYELEKKIDDAASLNTILFIDEAYALEEHHVTQLLSPMTDAKLGLVVVFALYEKEYDNFVKKNDGIASRCDHYSIPDYTAPQLMDIFKRMCNDSGYGYTDVLCSENDNLGLIFKNWYDTREIKPEYANARDVENLLSKMALSCDKRVEEARNTGIETEYTLTLEDIPEMYKETISSYRRSCDIDTVIKEFDNYCGFNNIKEYIRTLNDINLLHSKLPKYFPSKKHSLGHYAFIGEPGTGKSTAAEIFAKCLYTMGYIKTPNFKKILAGDLKGRYLGDTSGTARQLLNSNRYGVILIDEAYALRKTTGSGTSGDIYTDEAVNELLIFLEEEMKSGDTVVILAGYEDEINEMIDSHKGLRSRVPNIIRFDNYNEEECIQILKLMLSKEETSYTLSPEAEVIARLKISELIAGSEFSNARDIRTLASRIITAKSRRIAGMIKSGRIDEINDDVFSTITVEDFE